MKEILCLIVLNVIALILFEVKLIIVGCLQLQCAHIISGDVLPDLLVHSLKQMHPVISRPSVILHLVLPFLLSFFCFLRFLNALILILLVVGCLTSR